MSNYLERILTVPKGSFFLFGMRGVGKSSWVNHVIKPALKINLLEEEKFHLLNSDPGAFSRLLENIKSGSWIILDEVQKIPSLLNEVHRYIEDKNLKFALLGSSSRKLKKVGVNLLAGRAVIREMYPLTPAELTMNFSLEKALRIGTLPLIVRAEEPVDTLNSYVMSYLKEEIQAEALTRNLGGFTRFLTIAALMHGQTLNISNVARDAGVSRASVEGYFSILEDTLLGFKLSGFEARLRVRERSHPKFYFNDPGIVRAIKKRSGASLMEEEKGALFEGFIAMLLRAYNKKENLFSEINYWSPAAANDTEVDFLLSHGDEKIAIEVKSAKKFSQTQLKGLTAIKELKGLVRRVLVYQGSEPFKTQDGIEIMPFARFDELLAENKLWR